jgi:hypothetical protein
LQGHGSWIGLLRHLRITIRTTLMITRRKPIRKVSKRRAAAMVEYRRRRIAFLEKHPFCQVWIMETLECDEELTPYEAEAFILKKNGIFYLNGSLIFAPRSTDIHHTKKPKATYLNDESTWLAVCREMHDKIENNKSWAREKGYLKNI